MRGSSTVRRLDAGAVDTIDAHDRKPRETFDKEGGGKL